MLKGHTSLTKMKMERKIFLSFYNLKEEEKALEVVEQKTSA